MRIRHSGNSLYTKIGAYDGGYIISDYLIGLDILFRRKAAAKMIDDLSHRLNISKIQVYIDYYSLQGNSYYKNGELVSAHP